jgi:hypothetical protein
MTHPGFTHVLSYNPVFHQRMKGRPDTHKALKGLFVVDGETGSVS